MPYIYPAPPATLSGDNLTISRFLQSPTLLTRRLRTLAENRFIADVLLAGRYSAQGGAVLYEQNESIFPTRNPEAVEPGAEFPVTPLPTGAALLASVTKWGLDTLVTDEAIRRLLMDPVSRALIKLTNGIVQKVDTVALAAIGAAVTQTYAASAVWTGSTATILRDILKARAIVLALNQGYDPDTAVVTDTNYALLMSDQTITAGLRREDPKNPIYTGDFPRIAGMDILPSPNLPSGVTAMILDRKVLGGLAEEEPLQGKSIRDEEEEQWRLRAKRTVVPVVIEPASAVKITGT